MDLCLHYRPETVHCSTKTKDAHTSEITFLLHYKLVWRVGCIERLQSTTKYNNFRLEFPAKKKSARENFSPYINMKVKLVAINIDSSIYPPFYFF